MTDYTLTRTLSGCCHPLALACQAGPELVCRICAVDANQHDDYTHIEASFEDADVVFLTLSTRSFRVLPGHSLRRPRSTSLRACALQTGALVCIVPETGAALIRAVAAALAEVLRSSAVAQHRAPPMAETRLPSCASVVGSAVTSGQISGVVDGAGRMQ